MSTITPKYAAPWPDNKLLSVENLLERLEADPHNLVRNADFRMANYQAAAEATFAFWSLGIDPSGSPTADPDGDTPRRADLASNAAITQDIYQLFGDTTSWGGQPLILAILVEFSDPAGFGRAEIAHTGAVTEIGDTLALSAAQLPNAVQLVYGSTSGSDGDTAAQVTIRNQGPGTMTVHYVHLGRGYMLPQILPQRAAAGAGLTWLGSYDAQAATISAPSGCRLLRLEDVRVTVGGGTTTGTATVNLSTAFPAGSFVSGDAVEVFATADISGTAANLTRLGLVGGTVSGTTLTVAVQSVSGITFSAGTVVVNLILLVFPQPATVASRGASRRAYPYD